MTATGGRGPAPPRGLVVGAGVIGLTTAACLVEAGWRVEVCAAEIGDETTSGVAAAVWDPYKVDPPERVLQWAADSFAEFTALARTPATGVQMRSALRLMPEDSPKPWWLAAVPEWREAQPAELPNGYTRAYVFPVPVIDMSIYLGWLLTRLEHDGVAVQRRRLDSFADVDATADVLFDCAGVGAGALAGDDDLRPVRGQVVRVRNPGLERVIVDEFHPGGVTYIVPRSRDCVLGGTTEEGTWDVQPDPDVAAGIVARCAAIVPELADAEVLGHAAGLRPVRSAVRVEREDGNGVPIVHCYGHGGAGVTLSWGSAREAVALAASVRPEGP